MENILELNHVSKVYNDFALDDLCFSLKRGFIMGFIGPNGSGKSTTIRCIMGLAHINSGEIRMFGMNYHEHMKELKERIGFVYDQDVFFEDLTVEKNKQIISSFYKQWDDNVFYQYIKKFEVPLKKPIKSLSKGTKMKFALAIALSHHAELIIMDEPTSGLDPIFRKELLDILLDIIQDENKAIFFSTHITTDLEQVADYITFILDGKIILSEETETLLDNYVLVKGPKKLKDQIEQLQPIMLKETSLGFEAFLKRNEANQLETIIELSLDRPTLEDIMYYLVKSQNTRL
ncbi:ABC transporter ATP-binding protein [Tepidibacillus fermentans]|uniref:ABC-2 type transport system ATP-binding protein n=1 Tax=Tepidibacillus fermentans TaxID=1281767 RepID=A0A4R3KH30_9BACI|nr:ABC transporter ATP-binding protein [Tepidibacillus fermentans]TCS82570.1 ABC-2 type transport system ATP-binding protein [Tepidibacillus fermentans]